MRRKRRSSIPRKKVSDMKRVNLSLWVLLLCSTFVNVFLTATTVKQTMTAFKYSRALERSEEMSESLARTKYGAINSAFTCRMKKGQW